jgi:hypothetical protein
MKTIKTLKPTTLIAVVIGAIAAAEMVASRVCTAFALRFDSVAIAAVTTGLVVGIVAWRYDGNE